MGHDTEDDAQRLTADFSTPRLPYSNLLRQVLHSLGLGHLLVEGPPPTSPWVVLPNEPQSSEFSTAGTALALHDYILSEFLDAFKVPETRTRLVDHTSQFRIPPNIYPKLFKPPPLDDQVAATVNNGDVP